MPRDGSGWGTRRRGSLGTPHFSLDERRIRLDFVSYKAECVRVKRCNYLYLR